MDSRQPLTARRHQRGRISSGLVFTGFGLIALYFLVTEHRAHLAGWWPYLPFLLLAACPLLHLFHGGHDHGGHDHGTNSRSPASPNPEPDSKESSAHHHH